MPDRISQNGERLFTVRPRSSSAVTEKRGNVSSIRFHIPKDADKSKWAGTVAPSARVAFEQAVSETGFINFIAQNVSYDIQEKSQTLHTFGGQEAVYFYGRAPITVSLSGLLVDDLDNDQFCKFLQLYMDYLRGSAASMNYCYVELSINNATFTGAFTGIQVQQSSARDTDVTFSAQFLAKTFTLASTDSIFMDNGRINQPVVVVREGDPTISPGSIINAINKNFADTVDSVLGGIEDGINAVGGALGFGEYTLSFGTLPTVSDLIGFSASDITDFFGGINDFIGDLLDPIMDIANDINEFAQDVVGLVEHYENQVNELVNAVNEGIGAIEDTITSATDAVFGAIESIDDAITTICNFPDTIAGALGNIGGNGKSPLPVFGSDSISPEDSESSLTAIISVGSARGTPEGTSAVIAVNNANSGAAGLTPQTPGDDAPPSLNPNPPGLTPTPPSGGQDVDTPTPPPTPGDGGITPNGLTPTTGITPTGPRLKPLVLSTRIGG